MNLKIRHGPAPATTLLMPQVEERCATELRNVLRRTGASAKGHEGANAYLSAFPIAAALSAGADGG